MILERVISPFLHKLQVRHVVELDGSEATKILQGCYVLPYTGGVYLDKDTFYGHSAFLPTKVKRITALGKFLFLKHLKCATVIEHGPWKNYYHWLVDCIPRLWGLINSDIEIKGEVVLLISRRMNKAEMLLVKSLLPENVVIRRVNRFVLFRVETFVFLPFLSRDRSGKLPFEYLTYFRKRVYSAFGITPARQQLKIFISRRSSPKRRFSNQSDVEGFLVEQGFLCLQLEKLPINRQIEYFANANIVVGSHGAGLTNIMFAPVSCRVIEIFHSAEFQHLCHYRDLAQALGLSYSSIVLDAAGKDDWAYLSLERIRAALDDSG